MKPALQGDEIWCQLFSEPAGGSDVAGLRTRAEKNGDDWIVNGQKIWTTGAQFSDYGIVLTRTDPNVPKHKGLTMFYLSMKSPGVEVRPIKQASGACGFNEVFFTDVKIPDSQRLGEVGQGWGVALTTLMHERLAVGGGTGGSLDVPQLMALARALELEDGPAMKNACGARTHRGLVCAFGGPEIHHLSHHDRAFAGQQPGPEARSRRSLSRRNCRSFGVCDGTRRRSGRAQGRRRAEHGAFQWGWMCAPGLRIAGGTDEILRNIIAERVLGLPQDVRVDKDIPFNKLPSGR